MENIGVVLNRFYEQNILTYIQMYQEYPIKLISLILDIVIVIFLAYELLRIVKDSRAWQLVKGIAFLVIATALSGLLKLHILNYILSTVMDWGVILIIIIFQPEIRRALEQLGGTNKFSRFFGDVLGATGISASLAPSSLSFFSKILERFSNFFSISLPLLFKAASFSVVTGR